VFNFVFDREHLGRPYPNLAPMMDASNGYHGMGDSYPYIVPCRLLYFCQDHNYPMHISYVNQPVPNNAYYPVGIGWFDFDQDYFAQMSDRVRLLLRTRQLRVLFYYHEGDNPTHEKNRLNALCAQHQLPTDCYRFVSGNTACETIENFVYFPDHELFYWRNGVIWNNRPQPGCNPHTKPRSRDFTLLSRIHKWWRSTVVSYLHKEHLLDRSYWSYGNQDIGDQYCDNPIRIHDFPGLDSYMDQFLKNGPYTCDTLTPEEHNSHWTLVPEHFEDSYCHLVLETFFDADGSSGAFLTEKTFKPIRHGQPFVIFGTAHSLATLRRLGYKTYDEYIDNSYDSVMDNTERFVKLISTVNKLSQQDLHAWFTKLIDDARYNQELFVGSKYNRLAELAANLNAV
jgi:hypothetical protein